MRQGKRTEPIRPSEVFWVMGIQYVVVLLYGHGKRLVAYPIEFMLRVSDSFLTIRGRPLVEYRYSVKICSKKQRIGTKDPLAVSRQGALDDGARVVSDDDGGDTAVKDVLMAPMEIRL